MELDLDAVRAELPALTRGAYMNTGTAGPLPEAAAQAVREALAAELEQGRIAPESWEARHQVVTGLRAAVAALLGSDPERVALTHHSTDGLNAAALGLRWRPGDVVVTTDLEHAAVQLVVGALRLRHGVEVRVAPLHAAPADPAGALAAALHPGPVRALFLSHVSYATGEVLPVRALADVAHAAGAAVVVDGAQGAGALRTDPAELGADFYTVSGQKWLCGPEGTGALWVAPGWEQRLQPGAVGYMGTADVDAEGYYRPAPGARRLEVGSRFGPALSGWLASLRWLQDLGWSAVWARTAALAGRARAALAAVPGVEVLTPADARRRAGLVAFRVPEMEAPAAVRALRQRGYLVRSIPGWNAVRASVGFFLREAEVDGLAEAVAALRPA